MEKRSDEDRGPALIAVAAFCVIAISVVVGLRLYIRLKILKFGTDDWFLAVTASSVIIVIIASACGIHFGLGKHVDVLSAEQVSSFLKLLWFVSICYGGCITLLKVTFLLQYRRSFPLPEFQRLCDAFLAFIIAWATAGTIGAILICRPIPQNWDPAVRENCPERLTFWVAFAIIHVATDVVIFAMPLPLLRTVPLPRMQKMVLMSIFSLGFFTCAISVIRATNLKSGTVDNDATWETVTAMMWSMVEPACAIVCLCIPTLRPLLSSERRQRADMALPRVAKDNSQSTGGLSRPRPVLAIPSLRNTDGMSLHSEETDGGRFARRLNNPELP